MKLQELIIKEGGHALSDAGVIRIKKGDIPATIKYVSELSGIPKKDLHKIGSVGKVDDSGDIDLAVDMNQHDPKQIHVRLVDKLGEKRSTYNHGTKIASYAIPIRGDEEKGLVQVDLMYTPNIEWAKFAYYSAGADSKYKGMVRTILLAGVAAALNEPGMDHFEYNENNELMIRAGRTLDLPVGLRRIFQDRPKKKRGEGYVKTMKSIPLDDFKQMHPEIEIKGGQVIVDDPEKVVKLLFGPSAKVEDVRTAEQVVNLIKRKFDAETQEKIFKFAAKRAGNAGKAIRLPKELTD